MDDSISRNELRRCIDLFENDFIRLVSIKKKKILDIIRKYPLNDAYNLLNGFIISKLPNTFSKISRTICVYKIIEKNVVDSKKDVKVKNFFIKAKQMRNTALSKRRSMSYEELDTEHNIIMKEYYFGELRRNTKPN